MRKPTIYEALEAKLGRTPTDAELKADVKRILDEVQVELAAKGKLKHQRARKGTRHGKRESNPVSPYITHPDPLMFRYYTYGYQTGTSGAGSGRAQEAVKVFLGKLPATKRAKVNADLSGVYWAAWSEGYMDGVKNKRKANPVTHSGNIRMAHRAAKLAEKYGAEPDEYRERSGMSQYMVVDFPVGWTTKNINGEPFQESHTVSFRFSDHPQNGQGGWTPEGRHEVSDIVFSPSDIPSAKLEPVIRDLAKGLGKSRDVREAAKTVDYVVKKYHRTAQLESGMRSKYNPPMGPQAERRNPLPDAREAYQEFHGTSSTSTLEFPFEFRYHSNLAEAGDLINMKVQPLYGSRAPKTAKGSPKLLDIDFTRDEIKLGMNEAMTQLYFVGGDQSQESSLESLWGLSGPLAEKDSLVLGVVHELTYRTKKAFDKLKTIDYYHALGEETGNCPLLTYDRLNQRLALAGGEYTIEDRGIVN